MGVGVFGFGVGRGDWEGCAEGVAEGVVPGTISPGDLIDEELFLLESGSLRKTMSNSFAKYTPK